jgi:hypothetical protein
VHLNKSDGKLIEKWAKILKLLKCPYELKYSEVQVHLGNYRTYFATMKSGFFNTKTWPRAQAKYQSTHDPSLFCHYFSVLSSIAIFPDDGRKQCEESDTSMRSIRLSLQRRVSLRWISTQLTEILMKARRASSSAI